MNRQTGHDPCIFSHFSMHPLWNRCLHDISFTFSFNPSKHTEHSLSPHSGKIALIDAASGRQITFPQLYRSVEAVASYLSTRLHVRKGHVVLLLSPNSVYFPVISLAVMSLGAILTTNPLNTPQEIAKQIVDSNPVIAFITRSLISKINKNNFPIVLLEEILVAADDSRIVTTIEDMIRTELDLSLDSAEH